MGNEPPKFRDKRLRKFSEGYKVKDFQAFERQLDKRLKILEEATQREDLRLLPSNSFEALRGDRKGQFSIRINKQWRLCFEWPAGADHAFNIEVVDYH
jgi:toxin HigB-1